MEWSNKTALKLIDLYRERRCLWDPANCDYKNKINRFVAWKEISELLQVNMNDVKKKMESLLTSYRRERQREEIKTRSGSDEVYKSTWFAFSSMGFLQDKFAGKKTVNSEELYENIEDRHINTEGISKSTAKRSHNLEPDGASTSTDRSKTASSSSKRKKSRFLEPSTPNQSNQSRADKAYDLMVDIIEKRCSRDESSIYGDYIAGKHRKYSQHTKSVVEHLVGETLFKADMGLYENYSSSQTEDRFYNP